MWFVSSVMCNVMVRQWYKTIQQPKENKLNPKYCKKSWTQIGINIHFINEHEPKTVLKCFWKRSGYEAQAVV